MATAFITYLLLLAFQSGIALVLENSGFCRYVTQVNCSEHESGESGTLCGSDGVTYANHCEFTKVHCTRRALTIKQIGPCPVELRKQEIVLSVVCGDVLDMDCTTYSGNLKYCGTDGISYETVKPFFTDGILGRKQEIVDPSAKPNMMDSLGRKRKLTG